MGLTVRGFSAIRQAPIEAVNLGGRIVRWADGKSSPGKVLFDAMVKSRLVFFDGKHIVAALILNDTPRTLALRVERIGGDHSSIEIEQSETQAEPDLKKGAGFSP